MSCYLLQCYTTIKVWHFNHQVQVVTFSTFYMTIKNAMLWCDQKFINCIHIWLAIGYCSAHVRLSQVIVPPMWDYLRLLFHPCETVSGYCSAHVRLSQVIVPPMWDYLRLLFCPDETISGYCSAHVRLSQVFVLPM